MTLYSRKRGLVSSFDSVNRVYYSLGVDNKFKFAQIPVKTEIKVIFIFFSAKRTTSFETDC